MPCASPALPNAAPAVPNFMLREHVAALRCHLQQCSQARGWWFGAAALGEQVHALVAPRLISTLAGAMLVIGLVALWT